MPWTESTRAWGARWGLIALFVLLVVAYLRFADPSSPWSPQKLLGMRMPEPKEVVKIERVVVEGPPQIKIVPKESVRVVYRDCRRRRPSRTTTPG